MVHAAVSLDFVVRVYFVIGQMKRFVLGGCGGGVLQEPFHSIQAQYTLHELNLLVIR